METAQAYFEHPGNVIDNHGFPHVMALALNPLKDYKEGVVRCITSRDGNVHIGGYIDRSILYTVEGTSIEYFKIGHRLLMDKEAEVVASLSEEGFEFIGFEDPDIWVDENTGLMHMYFTVPFMSANPSKDFHRIHLGHAVGKDLESLVMTRPALTARKDGFIHSVAKEVSIAPVNSQGIRLNLFEGVDHSSVHDFECSSIKVAIAKDMGEPWEFGDTVFHPEKEGTPWIAGHASPGPLLPRSFIDVGEGKLVGIINGREANRHAEEFVEYGVFSVGLCIYDYEQGVIDWMSPQPFIRGSKAKYITFASQFIETGPGKGVLYAHVDDSYMQLYSLHAEQMRMYLP